MLRTEPGDVERSYLDLLAYHKLLESPEMARLYVHVVENQPVTADEIKRDTEMPHSTVYSYLRKLEEFGVVEREASDGGSDEITARRIDATVDDGEGQGQVRITTELLKAVSKTAENDDIELFVERHGVAKLAAALEMTRRVLEGELTERTAADRLGVHPVEGMTVFDALRGVLEATEKPSEDETSAETGTATET